MNLRGSWQAAYTAGVVLPKPVARCRYWHRNLNPKKLIEVSVKFGVRLCTLAACLTITIRGAGELHKTQAPNDHGPDSEALQVTRHNISEPGANGDEGCAIANSTPE